MNAAKNVKKYYKKQIRSLKGAMLKTALLGAILPHSFEKVPGAHDTDDAYLITSLFVQTRIALPSLQEDAVGDKALIRVNVGFFPPKTLEKPKPKTVAEIEYKA